MLGLKNAGYMVMWTVLVAYLVHAEWVSRNALDEKIQLLEITLAQQAQVIKYQKEKLEKLIRKSIDFSSLIKDKETEIEQLNCEVFEHRKNLRPLERKITILENQIESLCGNISQQVGEITALLCDIELKDAQIAEYKQKLEDISADDCLPFGNSTHLHAIRIQGMEPFLAPCESRIAGPGWMVIQRRIDGKVNFNRNWQDYKDGFGNVHGEFWIGLEKLHKLTNSRRYELFIYLVNSTNSCALFARYDQFVIGSEAEQYKLKTLGKYSGTANDNLSYHENMSFTTLDRDNDKAKNMNLAVYFGGPWWHKHHEFR